VIRADLEERFMDLVTRHQRRLFGYIYALVQNVNDTQDLHQQTLMILWRKFSQYEEGSNFLAWATKIAQIEVLRFRKSQPASRVFLSDEVLSKVVESQLRQTTDPATESRQALLERCVERLGAIDRELLDASYRQDCRIKDIAAQVGRSSQSICNSLRRIRRELLKCIDRAAGEGFSR
jgi:RNA polymerase sigma-70 factor, ECF subfamily